ncbi:MAG: gamma-glutamyltransferase [Chloroflexi bacterium]|nr:gamma-glutamyltransferase [Chloroflexota bacterium]
MERHRPIVMGSNGIVASGHHLASTAGLRVLMDGGNAFDAAIAAAAVVSVVKPSANSIGGHVMALLWDARTNELHALDANGTAPLGATPDRYRDGIPAHGPLSVSVPGVVAAWDAVSTRFGTRGLGDLLQPAIDYAEHGFGVNHLLHARTRELVRELAKWPTTAAVFLPGGRAPGATDVLRQPDLAASLRLIASEGAAAFYRGRLAERIGAFMASVGGLVTADDLANYSVRWSEPLRTAYRDVECRWQPPSSQGFIIGQELNVFSGYSPAALSLDERVHVMVEAKNLAFADRDRYLGDGASVSELLSAGHADRQRSRIGSSAAGQVEALELAAAGGETTYLCVVDGMGNAVSFIQSIFAEYGSHVVAGDTGIVLNNRMTGFVTTPGHVNQVGPGKRPVMTLNACMLLRDGRPWVVYGTPGSQAQVQTNFQNAVHFVDDSMDVQAAIEAPRWRHDAGRLYLEGRFPVDLAANLRHRGHDVEVTDDWSYLAGGAQAIMIDPASGLLQAGADPRREGYAIGF